MALYELVCQVGLGSPLYRMQQGGLIDVYSLKSLHSTLELELRRGESRAKKNQEKWRQWSCCRLVIDN